MPSPEAPATALPYRPDIDGLRALAVVPVLFFHAGLGCSGGYVGVDVFFVVSGFLITGLLRKLVEGGTFSLSEFWHRRIRRLWPALSALVLTVLAVGLIVLFPRDLVLLAESTAAQALLSSNVYFWSQSGYFGPDVESMPLLHTWSLAVEEQFYLLYPLPFAWLLRRGLRSARTILGIVFVASLAYCIYQTPVSPSLSFYLLPTRAWELTLGALLALGAVPELASRPLREVLSVAGLAAIVYAVLAYDSQTAFPGLAALLPCLGAAAVVHSNTDAETIVGRLLSWGPLVFLGLISYSLYLWHWPALVYLRYAAADEPSVGARLATLALSFVIAWISWRFVETPVRKKQILADRRAVFFMAGVFTVVTVSAAVIVIRADGLPTRFSEEAVALTELGEDEDEEEQEDEEDEDVGEEEEEEDEEEAEAEPSPAERDFTRDWRQMKWGSYEITAEDVEAGRLLILGNEDAEPERPDFVLWGDSHARVVLRVLDEVAREHGAKGYAAIHAGIVPLLGCRRSRHAFPAVEYNRAVVDFIREHRPRNVVLVARWTVNVEGREDGKRDALITDSDDSEVTMDNARAAFERGLGRTLAEFAALDLDVWVLLQVPQQPKNVNLQLAHAVQDGEDPDAMGVTWTEHAERQAFAMAAFAAVQSERVHVLDPADVLFDDAGRSVVRVDHKFPAYRDFHHLSKRGARLLAPVLERIFRRSDRER